MPNMPFVQDIAMISRDGTSNRSEEALAVGLHVDAHRLAVRHGVDDVSWRSDTFSDFSKTPAPRLIFVQSNPFAWGNSYLQRLSLSELPR